MAGWVSGWQGVWLSGGQQLGGQHPRAAPPPLKVGAVGGGGVHAVRQRHPQRRGHSRDPAQLLKARRILVLHSGAQATRQMPMSCLCRSGRLPRLSRPARQAIAPTIQRPVEHRHNLTSQIALNLGKSTPKAPADWGAWLSSRSPSRSLDLMVIECARSPGCGTQAAMCELTRFGWAVW